MNDFKYYCYLSRITCKFFERFGTIYAKTGKELLTSLKKNVGRALEFRAWIGSAAMFKKLKEVLSTVPGIKSFHHTVYRLDLENSV